MLADVEPPAINRKILLIGGVPGNCETKLIDKSLVLSNKEHDEMITIADFVIRRIDIGRTGVGWSS
jgi:hypothetical protein